MLLNSRQAHAPVVGSNYSMALAVTGKDLKKEKEGKGELGTGKPAIGPGTPAHTLPDTSKTKPLGRKAR